MKEISLSEARQRLSQLLREIEVDPGAGYRIKIRDKIVAELRSPAPKEGAINAGTVLVSAARKAEKILSMKSGRHGRVSSTNYKEYLYGDRSPLLPRRRS